MLGEDSGLEVDGPRRRARDPLGPLRARGSRGGREAPRRAGGRRGARQPGTSASSSLIAPDGRELRGTGTLEGRIADEPRGSEGFGYDPVFVPDGEERTVAELGNDWKSRNSHRARADAGLCYARPEGSASSRFRCEESHQLISAPKTITFAIT